jgi:hypothetical protein
MIGDVDGSGINQVVYFPAPPTRFGPTSIPAWAVGVSPGGAGTRDGLLKSVNNGVGATLSFDTYTTAKNMGQTLPVPVWVVKQTSTRNNINAGRQSVYVQRTYQYDTPIYGSRDREFVWFHATTEGTSGGSANAPGTVVKTTFATDACDETSTVDAYRCSYPFADYSVFHATRGLPAVVETSDDTGKRLTTLTSAYTFQISYNGLDGRNGINVQTLDRGTYLWDEGNQTGTTGPFVSVYKGFPKVPGPPPDPDSTRDSHCPD